MWFIKVLTFGASSGYAGELWTVHAWVVKGKHKPQQESFVRDCHAWAIQLQILGWSVSYCIHTSEDQAIMGWDGSHPFLIKLTSFTILVAIWQGSPLLMGFVALFMCICLEDLKTSILVIKHVMSNALLNQCNLLSLLPQWVVHLSLHHMLVCCGGDSEGKLRTIVSAFKALIISTLKWAQCLVQSRDTMCGELKFFDIVFSQQLHSQISSSLVSSTPLLRVEVLLFDENSLQVLRIWWWKS